MTNTNVNHFSIIRRISFWFSLFVLSFYLTQSCLAKTVQWDDISTPLYLKNYKLIPGNSLRIEVYIPDRLILNEKKVKLKMTGDRSPYTYLRINGIQQAYYEMRYNSANIQTKYLRPGLNDISFRNTYNVPNIINSLEFDIPNLASYQDDGSKSYEKQKSATLDSHEFIWNDFTTPLNIDKYKLSNGQKATVWVDITEDFKQSSDTATLLIDIDVLNGGPQTYHYLSLNNGFGRYNISNKKTVRIKTKHLFSGRNNISIICNFQGGSTLRGLRFEAPNLIAYKMKSNIDNSTTLSTTTTPLKLTGESTLIVKKTTLNNPDAIAVIIGNQNYTNKDIPPVKYAANDAIVIKSYMVETMGYKDGNIIFESDVTKAELEMIFGTEKNHRGMLYNYIKPEKSDVFIYYSGHGSPDPQTNKAYILPTDCNPVMMDLTAYPLDVLYGNLPKIEAKSITIVLDACFSGGTNTGQFLVQNASPALIKINNPVTAQNNLTIFTSAKNNQVSSWYPEKQHSMFTYFFLTAITGSADINRDKQITYQEIYDFVADRAEGVPYYAKRLHGGRIQNPTMQAADKDAVFVRF